MQWTKKQSVNELQETIFFGNLSNEKQRKYWQLHIQHSKNVKLQELLACSTERIQSCFIAKRKIQSQETHCGQFAKLPYTDRNFDVKYWAVLAIDDD